MVAKWTTATVVVTAVPLCIVILIGIFGNLMVLFISTRGNRVRTKGRPLIASLALADTLESTNLIFMLVAVGNYGEWIFSDALCQLNGFLTTVFVISSMYSLTAISVNRYFMVVKQNVYRKVFNARNQALIIAFIWCIPLPLAIGPLLGWSKFEFQTGKCICLFLFSRSVSFSNALLIITVPLPLSIICVCCFKIFKQVKHHSQQVSSMASSAPTVNLEEVKITKTLAVVIGAYLICFIPAATINLIEMVKPNFKIPLWIDVFSVILVFSNHANNPIIYGALNKQYRKAFRDIFVNLLGGRCSLDRTTNSLDNSTGLGDKSVLSRSGQVFKKSSNVTKITEVRRSSMAISPSQMVEPVGLIVHGAKMMHITVNEYSTSLLQ